jgi:integrase
MATLERREQTPGNVSYRVRWWADNKQRSKSFKDQASAKRFKALLEGDMVNGTYIDPKVGTVTLASFATESLPALLLDVRPSTRARMESIYKIHIAPEFGHMPLTAITGAMVGDWMVRMGAERGAATVRKNVHVLRRLLGHAVNQGLLRANPAESVRLPAEPRHEQRYLTHDQTWTLAESIHPRFRAMVLVAVFGGLRYGEVCGLQRQHINAERNTVTVKQTLVEVGSTLTFGPPKTKTSVRVVTLPRSIMAEIVTHMGEYVSTDPDALLFTGQRGKPLSRNNWYRHYWQAATKAAGMEGLRFHDLRHTFVALWVDLGRNPKEVSRAAGHSSVAFTLDRYGHLYETDHDGLADELDAMLSGHIRTHDRTSGQTRAAGDERKRVNFPPFHGGSANVRDVGEDGGGS